MSFRKISSQSDDESIDSIKSGAKCLDQIFGGGIPVNNLIVFEQDEMNVFNDLLMRSIASNCLYEKYNLTYVTTKDESILVSDFIQTLPVRRESDQNLAPTVDPMKIAFRYNHMPLLASESNTIIDFGKRIDEKEVLDKGLPIDNIRFLHFKNAAKVLSSDQASSTPGPHIVVINDLKPIAVSSPEYFAEVIYRLKSLSRILPKTVIILTYQSDYFSLSIRNRIRHISDSTIQIKAFDPLKPTVYERDFRALLYVHKVSRLSFVNSNPLVEMGIKMEKNGRFFSIQELFIPPDIGDTASRQPPSIANEMF